MNFHTFVQCVRPASIGTVSLKRKELKLLKPYIAQLPDNDVSRVFRCTVNDIESLAVYQRDIDLLAIIPLVKEKPSKAMTIIKTDKLQKFAFSEEPADGQDGNWVLEINYQGTQFKLYGEIGFLVVKYIGEWLQASNKLSNPNKQNQVTVDTVEKVPQGVMFPDGSFVTLDNNGASVVHVLPAEKSRPKPRMYSQLVDKQIDKIVAILNSATSIIYLLQYKKAINVLYAEGKLSDNEREILMTTISQNIIRFRKTV